MKRGAERQLTRDEAEEEDEYSDDGEPGRGIQKANAAEMSNRPIRGLPRRAVAGAANAGSALSTPLGSTTPSLEVSGATKFSGFSGFGSSTNTTPFSFSAPQKLSVPLPATSNLPAPTLSAFSSNASSFAPSNTPPTASTSASNATKLFTSIVNSSSPAEPKLPNGNSSKPAEDDKVKAETTYYTALRGLNVAFLAACKKAVDADPYTDIAGVLERYKELRSGIKSDFDEALKKPPPSTQTPTSKTEPKAPAAPSSFSGFGGPSIVPTSASTPTPQTKSPFAMPAPPSGFSGFNLSPAAPVTSLGDGGFKPQLVSSPPSTKAFAFGDKPSGDSSKFSEAGASNGVRSAFQFGASDSSSPFVFGDSGKKAEGTIFGSAPSVFSSSPFGIAPIEPKAEQNDKPKDPAPLTNIFGGPATPEKSSPAASSPFAFGSAAPKTTFGFRKSSGGGSIGNPVGFGFGSPPKTPEAGSSPTPSTSGFAFGAPKVAEGTSGDGEGAQAAASEDSTPPLLVTNSVHDQDGEGEEDEVTKFEQKCKVYKMAKKDDGKQEWKDMGVGLLKVKAHKETDARRLLLRNSSTGKIQINFNVHAGLNPSVAKNVVSLMGHENGVSLPYKLRVKTAEQANELNRILEEEVEKVKSKS